MGDEKEPLNVVQLDEYKKEKDKKKLSKVCLLSVEEVFQQTEAIFDAKK